MSGTVINPQHQSNLCGERGGETQSNQFSKYCSPCFQPVPYQRLSGVCTVWVEIAPKSISEKKSPSADYNLEKGRSQRLANRKLAYWLVAETH